jgi:hypothetical protein
VSEHLENECEKGFDKRSVRQDDYKKLNSTTESLILAQDERWRRA